MDRTEHDNDETALATSGNETTAPSVADLEKHVADLAASPHFVPLMGSFRDLLEAERRRNRLRTLILGGGTVLVLALFIWGPLHMMQTYIRQSEQRISTERQALERVELALNESMRALVDVSRDLRTTLEVYRQTPVPPAASAQAPEKVPAATSRVEPVVPTGESAVAAVTSRTVPATGTLETVTATVPATNAPAPVAAVPPDLFRALNSTPAVPTPPPVPTNRVAAPTAAAAETRLTDTLADVERAILSIRQRRAAITNAPGAAKP
jgi:hypothetical protein